MVVIGLAAGAVLELEPVGPGMMMISRLGKLDTEGRKEVNGVHNWIIRKLRLRLLAPAVCRCWLCKSGANE